MKQPCDKNCPDRQCRCAESCERWKEYTAKRNKQYLVNAIVAIYRCNEPKKKRERK